MPQDDRAAVRAFHFRLSQIFRSYGEAELGLNETDLTRTETTARLARAEPLASRSALVAELDTLFDTPDSVKFAGTLPDIAEQRRARQTARHLVEELRRAKQMSRMNTMSMSGSISMSWSSRFLRPRPIQPPPRSWRAPASSTAFRYTYPPTWDQSCRAIAAAFEPVSGRRLRRGCEGGQVHTHGVSSAGGRPGFARVNAPALTTSHRIAAPTVRCAEVEPDHPEVNNLGKHAPARELDGLPVLAVLRGESYPSG